MNKSFISNLNKPISYMLLTLLLTLMVSVITNCVAQTSDTNQGDSFSTTGILCDVSRDEYNSSTSVEQHSTYTWTCSDTERSLTANGIPDHEVGTFPNNGNPFTISEQSISATLTLTPVETDIATALGGPRGVIAHALNGVKFDPGTGGTCDDSGSSCSLAGGTGSWRLEALGQTAFNFGEDFNNAHVQPGGEYHYHGIPEDYLSKLSKGEEAMTLVGWAADGFPVYARYGYSDATDANSAIKVITGSYQTKATPDENRPDTSLYAMGTFTQDWEYVEGIGDLDECNGRMGVTPEFPNGIYHYYATDTYPFMSRCVKGEVDSTRLAGAPFEQLGIDSSRQTPLGGLGGPGSPPRPNFTQAAKELGVTVQTLMEALGPPPPNLEVAAAKLGITVQELRNVLPPPPPSH